jgi:hypothetical protein
MFLCRIRVNAQGQLTNAEELVAQKFGFDQEDRHRLFWEYIREKDWKSAATFIDKRAIAYYNNEPVFRRYRIMNLLVELFDETTWLVLYNPMKFKAGVTKSVVICDPLVEENVPDQPDGESVEEDKKEENIDSNNQAPTDEKTLEVPVHNPTVSSSGQMGPANVNAAEQELGNHRGDEINEEHFDDEEEQQQSQNQNLDDPYGAVKFRPKARNLNLPFAIFVDDFEGKEFEKSVEESTQREVSRLIYAATNEMLVSKELGVNNLSRKLMQLLRNEIKRLPCLQNANYEEVIQSISAMTYPAIPENEMVGFSFNWSKGLDCIDKLNIEHSMIKSGKFGPEVDDFTMPLPTNFPAKAGQAKYALYEPLSRYEEHLKKLEVESLPTTLEEVYEPTAKERLYRWYHKMNKTDQKIFEQELSRLIKIEVIFRKVESSTYIASRRKTYFSLPGLTRQYPNPHYPSPAVIPKHVDFKRSEVSKVAFVDKLFGKEVLKGTIVPPVGRKPSPQEMYAIQNRVYRNRGSQSLGSHATPKINYEVNILDNLVKIEKATLLQPQSSKNYVFDVFFPAFLK